MPAIESPALQKIGARHAFFTRNGGVSEGVYASLNGGVGSNDQRDHVAENRARMASALGVAASHLLVPYQIHSAECLIVDRPFEERPRCDALATKTPGLALGVTGADCGMILFCDPQARVIGAAHSGWKGALADIIGATVAAMEKLGARRADIVAALGPTIAQESYETGPEFHAQFIATNPDFARFFAPSRKPDHFMFDLHGLIGLRAQEAGIRFEDLGLDTYADAQRFFSFRRTTHRKEPDYGRLVSAIVIEG
ncbi:MAG: peptidoglycan editing factor PgeF [Hyphomicrobiales bacterium]|nr:peptidoglycan editing factor PgeF [Hyphomicrobiales bacterium]